MDKVTPIGSSKSPKRRRPRTPAKSSQPSREHWEKAAQAYALKVGGKQLSEIADILDIPNIDDVSRLISERFKYDASYLTNQDRDSILGMELIRLDQLQAAIWPAAMMGDPKSVDSAVRIIATRAKIAGLDQVDPVVQKNLVLVVGDKEDDYIAALRATTDD